jgi:hypothetical protein
MWKCNNGAGLTHFCCRWMAAGPAQQHDSGGPRCRAARAGLLVPGGMALAGIAAVPPEVELVYAAC